MNVRHLRYFSAAGKEASDRNGREAGYDVSIGLASFRTAVLAPVALTWADCRRTEPIEQPLSGTAWASFYGVVGSEAVVAPCFPCTGGLTERLTLDASRWPSHGFRPAPRLPCSFPRGPARSAHERPPVHQRVLPRRRARRGLAGRARGARFECRRLSGRVGVPCHGHAEGGARRDHGRAARRPPAGSLARPPAGRCAAPPRPARRRRESRRGRGAAAHARRPARAAAGCVAVDRRSPCGPGATASSAVPRSNAR